MKIVQILIKSTTCKWSTGRLEKYWKPCICCISRIL